MARWTPLFLASPTSGEFASLGPYVPCVDDDGVVAFTAVRRDGSAAVVRCDGVHTAA